MLRYIIILMLFLNTKAYSQKEKKILCVNTIQNIDTAMNTGISAFIRIDSFQNNVNKGIKFSIRLKNCTSQKISIFNPIYNLICTLINTSSENVLYPQNSLHSAFYSPFDTLYNKTFLIDEILLNGEPTFSSEQTNKIISLSPSSNLEYKITILNEYKLNKIGTTETYMPNALGSSIYYLTIMFFTANSNASKISNFDRFQIVGTKIYYRNCQDY